MRARIFGPLARIGRLFAAMMLAPPLYMACATPGKYHRRWRGLPPHHEN